MSANGSFFCSLSYFCESLFFYIDRLVRVSPALGPIGGFCAVLCSLHLPPISALPQHPHSSHIVSVICSRWILTLAFNASACARVMSARTDITLNQFIVVFPASVQLRGRGGCGGGWSLQLEAKSSRACAALHMSSTIIELFSFVRRLSAASPGTLSATDCCFYLTYASTGTLF